MGLVGLVGAREKDRHRDRPKHRRHVRPELKAASAALLAIQLAGASMVSKASSSSAFLSCVERKSFSAKSRGYSRGSTAICCPVPYASSCSTASQSMVTVPSVACVNGRTMSMSLRM